MLATLTSRWGKSAEQWLRASSRDLALVALVALLLAIGVGFGTFAAYLAMAAPLGRVAAASIVAGIYLGIGTAIAVTAVIRRRAAASSVKPRPFAAMPDTAPAGGVGSLLQALASVGVSEGRGDLAAMMQLGKQLTMPQMLTITLLAGFLTGRKIKR